MSEPPCGKAGGRYLTGPSVPHGAVGTSRSRRYLTAGRCPAPPPAAPLCRRRRAPQHRGRRAALRRGGGGGPSPLSGFPPGRAGFRPAPELLPGLGLSLSFRPARLCLHSVARLPGRPPSGRRGAELAAGSGACCCLPRSRGSQRSPS